MLFPLLFVLSSVMAEAWIPLASQLPLIARIGNFYSWTFCNRTFGSDSANLRYSTSALPAWLSFDPGTLTFSGTPTAEDEGNPTITVTAYNSSTSISSTFTLCITPFPPPTLKRPISEQFTANNTALSSVFPLAPNSALATSHPALRIPPKWSFSIGFDDETFSAESNIFYDVRQSDGSPLPDWIYFNSEALTVNGITPNESTAVSLALLASDQERYTASRQPFDLVIASHELSMTTPELPTINVTESTPFNFTLSSPVDFAGVLLDARPIQPADITSLAINVSGCSTMKYDPASRTLSGTLEQLSSSPNTRFPVTVTYYNQSIHTNVSLDVVPSYFSSSSQAPIQAIPGHSIYFNLAQECSNATGHDDVKLTAAYEPAEDLDWLHFDSEARQLTGSMPIKYASKHIEVTFTAFSRVTHSTSHTTLPIVVMSADRSRQDARPGGLSAAAHKKLMLGLDIAFGIVGGLALIGGLLAAFRRCAKVEDTAIGGEEGRNVWSDQDKRWYGLDKVLNRRISTESVPPRRTPDYGHLGLGLRRISERSQSAPISDIGSPADKLRSPGVMSKREFIARIREAVRIVSDKAYGRKVSSTRPIIGKPILRSSQQPPPLPIGSGIADSPSNPFDGTGLPSHPGSTIMTNSPSTSTAEHSIPRRRADFAPPRSPALAHLEDNRLSRQLSTGSTGSLISNTSARTHAAEAVVHTASKAISIRSGKSSSGISQSALTEPAQAAGTRPRLVPFTSATRVPVPRRPSSPLLAAGSSTSRRTTSQTAKVCKSASPRTGNSGEDVAKSGSGDELRMGVHYMQSLGEDRSVDVNNSTLDASHVRSFSSLDASSLQQTNDTPDTNVAKALVRIGEKFRFRVPVSPATSRTGIFNVRLVSGEPLPRFLQVDMCEIAKGTVEFFGVPASTDLGKVVVGVYTSDGICVSQMVLEVVKWR